MSFLRRPLVCVAALSLMSYLGACSGHIEDGEKIGPATGGSKGGGGSSTPADPTAACDPNAFSPPPQRVWLLTGEQYAKSVATLFEGRSAQLNEALAPPRGALLALQDRAASPKFSTLANLQRLTPDRFDTMLSASQDVSAKLMADASIQACTAANTAFEACLTPLVKDRAELLFRRPLDDAEVSRYVGLATQFEAKVGREAAAQLAFKALLTSPHFLYRSEIGVDTGKGRRLDPFEVASALSYALTNGPPDQGLWEAAKSGRLATAEGLGQELDRIADNLGKSTGVREFVRELFDYGETGTISRNEKFHNPSGLIDDANRFVDMLVQSHSRKGFLEALLTAKTGVARDKTGANYNLTVTSKSPVEVTFEGERQGLLGHPAWLSSYAFADRNDPVRRGAFVRSRLLCGTVPNAPVDAVEPISEDTTITLRDRFAVHRENPSCNGCHRLMDDIGFALEGFDEYGRAREVEAGKPVVRTGEMFDSGDQDGPFEGLAGLTAKLTASSTVSACLAANSFEYFLGRPFVEGDACAVQEAHQKFRDSEGDYGALLKSLFTSESFLARAQ